MKRSIVLGAFYSPGRVVAWLAILFSSLLATQAAAEEGRPFATANELSRMVLHDPDSPVAGNPSGDVTIVAFLDYNCPFCRRSTPELARFLKTDSNVRVVFKDWPILSAASILEAKVALAAKYQGKYLEAHDALMAIKARPAAPQAVQAAVKQAEIDLDRLNKDLAAHNDEIVALLKRDNHEAEALGFQGTPVFLIGPFKMANELNEAGFRQAVADARAQPRGDSETRR